MNQKRKWGERKLREKGARKDQHTSQSNPLLTVDVVGFQNLLIRIIIFHVTIYQVIQQKNQFFPTCS